jgi:hypothetical protein
VREIHVFPAGADDHDLDRCWCHPDRVLAEDAETGERMTIVTHLGGESGDVEITEVPPG